MMDMFESRLVRIFAHADLYAQDAIEGRHRFSGFQRCNVSRFKREHDFS